MNPPHTWLMHTITASKRDREEKDYISFTPDFCKFHRAPLHSLNDEAEGRRLCEYLCIILLKLFAI